MSHSKKNIAATLAVVLLAAIPAYAGDTPSEIKQRIGTGDPEAGKEKSAFCQGCHGEDGNSVSPVFPKLAGQWADYVQKQIREFQNGARFNETMTDVAMSVDNYDDLHDITAYFASQKQMGSKLIENEADRKLYIEGEKLYNEGNAETGAFRCVKCHGEHGSGHPFNNNLFPVLGGQHKDYLVKQLVEFKHEVRENDRSGMMLRITTHLTDHDIEALATYLSGELPPPPPPPPPVVAEPPKPVAAWQVLMEAKTVSIEGTNFETNSAKLKKTASKQLSIVVDFAKNRPDAKLEVAGYSDNAGSEKNNMKLSLARAESVKKYLAKAGVAPDRVITKGLGPVNPIADNKTKEGRGKNRRVEIRALFNEEKKVLVTQ